MKINQVCIVLWVWLLATPLAKAQTFDKLWKQVEQAEKKSLPQTVVKLTTEIYRKGEKEKDSPQMLKAYLWRMKYQEILIPDSFYVNLKGLEQWVKQAEKPMDRAILHSLIAGIYADYANANSWQLRQRTEIVDETPSADIREWPANFFVEKVKMHTQKAMSDSLLLLETSSRAYVPFVVLGETSEYYHHDMYHLLASRSIEALEQIANLTEEGGVKPNIEALYQKMLSAYRTRGDKEGYVLTSLNYLEWKHNTQPDFRPFRAKNGLLGLTQDPYLAGLDELKADYSSLDICAEVYLAKANYALLKNQEMAALQLCEEAIRLYPRYRRIAALKNLREDILAPFLNVNVLQVAYPGEELKVKVSHKNLDGFTLRLYQAKKLITEQHYSMLRPKNYSMQDTVYIFKTPEVGAYLMRIVPDVPTGKDSENDFLVTRFKVLTCSLPGSQFEIVTLDGQTGHPIPHARVILYSSDEKVLQEMTTGADGKAVIPWNSDYRYIKATKGADTVMPKQPIYGGNYGYYGNKNKTSEGMTLLTDRSLYRPGQTVYVKGIAYEQQSDTANVVSGKEYTVTLMDVNNQEVGQKRVRTNEFGSFATDFALPSACLNGLFTLKAGRGETQIRVEDYKRPTFDITFEKQQGSYQLGDEVQVKGKVESYSGVLLQDLPVNYTVKRSAFSFWRLAENTQIASGEAKLNDNGEFTIPVRLEKGESYRDNPEIFYRYQVEVKVTNMAGETESSTEVISAGNRSLILQPELKNIICKDEPVDVVFKAQNLNGQPVEVEGTYRLFRVKDKDVKQLDETPAVTGTFASNKAMTFDWKNVPSGNYVLKVTAKDAQSMEVSAEVNVILFSVEDKRPPVSSPLWLYEKNTAFDAGHPALFYLGTSVKEAYVMMNAFCGEQLLESKVMNLSDTIVRFDYPYQEKYGDGIFVNFCLVKEGQVYQENVRLEKRFPDKTLALKWDVFRDKLRPGQTEEWKLTIRTPQGKSADAEMLATMYDASLDKIWSRKQGIDIYYNRSIPYFNWRVGYFGSNAFDSSWNRKYLKVPVMEYDHFVMLPSIPNAYAVSEYLRDGVVVRGYGVQKRTSITGAVQLMSKSIGNAANAFVFDSEQASLPQQEVETTEEQLPEAPADLRTNLAETAFFYPQLRTNEQGEVTFSFVMPESLTRWNFRGYSHTKGMLVGTLNGEATTSKEFMLTPNLPRFIRVGDKTSVAAAISNMTGKAQAGTVTLTLFDPMTEKVVSTQKQKFAVEAGKTIGVNFLFTVGDQQAVLGCRMIADSGTFSDGEQQLLPVLSNKEHLTETLPIPIRGQETRTFSLDSLFNRHNKSATERQLTIEFTGNPAWYAIQALPSLSLPTDQNAISWATAYYANTLASYIMNSQPRIKAVFDSWKLQGGTKDTFLNHLQKNQDVKSILLSESPWVLEAKTEQQQMERIATLFDLNHIRSNNISALTRLQELQNPNGAWSWYKGMGGSLYVTTYIAELNARLAMLTGERLSGTAEVLQNKAFSYLHQLALEEYEEVVKSKKERAKSVGVPANILQYLYLIAISGEQVPTANKAAYDYFLSKVEELLPGSSMDTKALVVVILDKAGRKKEAQEFVASLKEHLTRTDEQGMFFAFNENPYVWGEMKMQAHVDVMEALELVGGNSYVVEEMKLWLLKQKQTQQWNSPVATADAVYALLMNGTNLLDNQSDVRIVIADEVVETNAPAGSSVSGLGYVKRTFTQANVVNARSIKVEKKSPGIAWGAVYAQYESPISEVKQQGGELNVQKQLYVERMVNDVAQLQPITEKSILQVGDKVVSRLSIRVDRPMDFVQLKDQRGACFEPIGSVSGYRWDNGIGYYVDIKDASTNFFFNYLGKGVYVLEYSYRVSRAGVYETGLATMQCAYAPEYASHSGTKKVTVK